MNKLVALVTVSAVAAATFLTAAPASAAPLETNTSVQVTDFTSAQIDTALPEFRAAGLVQEQKTTRLGEVETKISLGGGATMKLIQPSPNQSRLWGGKDGNGAYVSFTNTDQAIIMGGGAWMLTAGLCAVIGAPTAGVGCGIATAIMIIVAGFVTSNGGSCPAGKERRVWVTNTGGRNPKCA